MPCLLGNVVPPRRKRSTLHVIARLEVNSGNLLLCSVILSETKGIKVCADMRSPEASKFRLGVKCHANNRSAIAVLRFVVLQKLLYICMISV